METALDNFQYAESLGLLYSRFEGHRCLAEVRFRRGEFAESERICTAASALVAETESRVSQLWLGPLYVDVLLAVSNRAKSEGRADEAATKLGVAKELLQRYQEW